MEQKKKERESNLQRLEELVQSDHVWGKEPYYFMRFIGTQYPLEFIRMMKMHRPGKVRIDKDMLDECLPFAISIVNDMYLKFQKFLIYPPRSEEEQEFDKLVEKLEELIAKQTKDN